MFGLKKSAETRKALRFFSERRIRAHFVDLAEKAMALGELDKFIQKFGVEGVLDRNSKRFEQLGFKHSTVSEGRWVDRLIEEPAIMRLPLVRKLGQPQKFSVGDAEKSWKEWLTGDINKPA